MARKRRGSIDSLQAATGPQGVNTFGLNLRDPLGIDAQTRGLAADRAARQAMVNRSFDEQNPLVASSAITGPLSDPNWAGYFQTLKDQGVTHLRGGPSADGSTQVTGTSAQPDWMPTSGLAPGVSPTGTAMTALDALRNRTTPLRPPMVDDAGKPAPDQQTPPPQAPPTATDKFSAFMPNPTPQPFVPSGPAAPSVRSTMADAIATIRKKNPR